MSREGPCRREVRLRAVWYQRHRSGTASGRSAAIRAVGFAPTQI